MLAISPEAAARNGGGRAVVRFQPHDARGREILLEAEDVLHLGPTPGIDRLVVVADAADVRVRLCQQPEPKVLDKIGVLVFVHQKVAEEPVILRQHVGLGPQDFRHVQQEIAEIGAVEAAQALLVAAVQLARPAGGEVGVFRRGDTVRRQAAILPALDDAHERGGRPALGVDPRRLHHLLEQAQLIIGVEDAEAAREAYLLGMAAKHPRAERVERAEPEPLGGPPEDGRDPFAHLAGRLVGERDGKHLPGAGAPGHQDVGEAGGQHARLAGSGAGQHQQRTVHGLHRLALLGVQAGEVISHAADIGSGASRANRPASSEEGAALRAAVAARRTPTCRFDLPSSRSTRKR